MIFFSVNIENIDNCHSLETFTVYAHAFILLTMFLDGSAIVSFTWTNIQTQQNKYLSYNQSNEFQY